MQDLTLISHHLCPYVQRAAISLAEKEIPFERVYVDLGDKPDWFKELSPLGKVPVLSVAENARSGVIFESAVILEYLEETQPRPLHPDGALDRAHHRAWIEYGSAILNRIAAFYNAKTDVGLAVEARKLADLFGRVEMELSGGPWFGGDQFSLVDAVYGPIFRYFDTFDAIADFGVFRGLPRLAAWRRALALRGSIKGAVTPDYPRRLLKFLRDRDSALSVLIGNTA